MIVQKKGHLTVETQTVSKSFLKTMNRKQRRSHLNSSTYSQLRRKINTLRGDLQGLCKVPAVPKTGGKYLTGYYSQLLVLGNSIVA
jgi:hypothetical protein